MASEKTGGWPPRERGSRALPPADGVRLSAERRPRQASFAGPHAAACVSDREPVLHLRTARAREWPPVAQPLSQRHVSLGKSTIWSSLGETQAET